MISISDAIHSTPIGKTLCFIVTVAAPTIMAGCGGTDQDEAVEAPRLFVSLTFEVDEVERASFDSLLALVLPRTPGSEGVLDGEVWRFGSPSNPRRYLLVRSEQLQPEAEAPEITFYVLQRHLQDFLVSERFETGITDHPGSFEILEITDLDGDSVPEVAFCGSTTPGDSVVMRALRYSDRWDTPLVLAERPLRCPPGRVP